MLLAFSKVFFFFQAEDGIRDVAVTGVQTCALPITVLGPIPSAKVSTATAVKPGDLRRVRTPKRKSCQQVSTKDSQPAERTTSFVTSRLPRSKRTARTASLRLMPCFIFSAASISKEHT